MSTARGGPNVTTRRAAAAAAAASDVAELPALDDDAAAAAVMSYAPTFPDDSDDLDVDMAMNIAAILEAESGIVDASSASALGLIAEQDEIMLSLADYDAADAVEDAVDEIDDDDGVLSREDDTLEPAAEEEEEEEDSQSDAAPAAASEASLESVLSKGYLITPTWDARSVLDARPALRCLNDDCIWMLSSARPGNGIEELLSMDVAKYWQSDGTAPHTILIQFYKRESIAELSMMLSFPMDESYCPQRIGIRAGSTMLDLEEVRRIELEQPNGYVRIPFINTDKRGLQRYLRCHVLQIVFVSNHQQGRDCHVRCMRVLAPPAEASADVGNVSVATTGTPLASPAALPSAAATRASDSRSGVGSLHAPRWQTTAMQAFGIR